MKAIIKFYVFDNIISLKYEAVQITTFWTYFAQISVHFCVDQLLKDQLKDREKLQPFIKDYYWDIDDTISFFIFLNDNWSAVTTNFSSTS